MNAVMKKILLIDHHTKPCSQLHQMLELAGFDVISVGSGWVGLELAKSQHPDLILCEIDLPGLNGYELLEQLRATRSIAKTPLMFLTTKADLENRCMAIALGADDYLVKPIDRKALLIAIETQLNSAVR